jgi:hypothetical protein
MYKIIKHIVDMAGIYMVVVEINKGTAKIFNFDHYPTQEEVDAVAQRFVDRHKRLEEQNASAEQDEPSNP